VCSKVTASFIKNRSDIANSSKVRKKIEEMGIEPENAELQRIPSELKRLDVDSSLKVLKIIEDFEDDDDVQNVYHNLDVTDEVANAIE